MNMRYLIYLVVMLLMPSAALGMEQTFVKNDTKVTVKLLPEKPEQHRKAQLSLKLEQGGVIVTDKQVLLAVYHEKSEQPLFSRAVDVLDGEYIDSWKFEEPGDYRISLKILDQSKPDEAIVYEVNASVAEAGNKKGFFAHHFEKWGWWGVGFMVLMMLPMMLLI